ncbi:MAG: HD domain-containing protein [Lachnospiraceae bacterium]|nr:HD domain-containing protein [Lachnospiraceae bacterium]
MNHSYKDDKAGLIMAISIFIGILVNVLLYFISYRGGLPTFFDTIGTIVIAVMGGMFPGILTALLTNLVCTFFNDQAYFFAFINILVGVAATTFSRRGLFKKASKIVLFIIMVGVMCGTLSSVVQQVLYGRPQNDLIASMTDAVVSASGVLSFVAFLFINIVLNILDKGITTLIACIIMRLFPKSLSELIGRRVLMQRPLTEEYRKSIREWSKGVKLSVRLRTALAMVGTSILLVLSVGGVCIKLYFDNVKEERLVEAQNAARLASEIIDPDMVDDYMLYGTEAPGYTETAQMIQNIWASYPNVLYLYVVHPEEDCYRYIFDADGYEGSPESYDPGELVPYEEGDLQIVPAMLAGEDVEPIETNDSWGWLITVGSALRDDNGNTLCYVFSDVSIEVLGQFLREFIYKNLFIISGIIIVVIAFAFWITGVYTAYPISSMAYCLDHFSSADEDQSKLDDNLRSIRSLDIQTEDETQMLYEAICRLTMDQTEQMRRVRRLSESTARMQDGLIVTMADMVESRDSDTGAHVQKTAAYVKIIVEGLKRKGYYLDKVDDKFISDVVRSAPLHDVGKINISDQVLNKPGKLTPEEFEIMKTHTTAGKKILENAISSVQGENYLKEARNMAAYHHERWDGKGYPEGLHGEVIPLSARIMAVADVFDALTSPRVYKPAFSMEESIEMIKEGAGTQFDPKCVEVFFESLNDIKIILKKYNQNG